MRLIFFLLLLAGASGAWSAAQHGNICRAAYAQMEQKAFDEELLYFGCIAPDLERDMYPPHIPQNGTDSRAAIRIYADLLGYSLERGNIQDASFFAGVMAHFIADTANPMHQKMPTECHDWGEAYAADVMHASSELNAASPESIATAASEYASKYSSEIESYCRQGDALARDRVLREISARAARLTSLAWSGAMAGSNGSITAEQIEGMKAQENEPWPAFAALSLVFASGLVLIKLRQIKNAPRPTGSKRKIIWTP